MMSTPLALPFRTAHSNTKLSNFFADAAGCKHDSTTACIKALSHQDVIKYQRIADSKFLLSEPIVTFMPWTPTLNQFELPDQPLDAFQKGNYQKMPIMMGSCREEAIMFVYLALSKSMTLVEYEGALAGLFLGYFARMNRMYPPAHSDKREDLSALATDFIFTAPTRNASKNIDKYNKATNSGDVFLYEFNHAIAADVWGDRYAFCKDRVCHGVDVPFFFDSILASGATWTSYEEYLTYLFKFYITNFATTGNPNQGPSPCMTYNPKAKGSTATPCSSGNSVLHWSTFNATSLANLQMDPSQTYMGKDLRKSLLDQWDYMGYAFGRKLGDTIKELTSLFNMFFKK